MTYTIEVPWFNPRQMDDDTVKKLSTNQEQLISAIEKAVDMRAKAPIPGKHWLVTGPRGAGKSFFLRSVKTLANKWQQQDINYILLPEELRNIFSPHEFLNEVRYLMHGDQIQSDDFGTVATWKQTDSSEQWQSALTALLNSTDSKLIVIGVENFDQLLSRAFNDDIKSSHLRTMLENEPRIMLIASAVEGSFDEDYNSRLFCQFEHHPILAWSPKAHRDYLTKRAHLKGVEPQPSQLARIDAYSRFTGGNARVAAVLASLLLEKQDPLNASLDLENTLDKMTDYYRSQLDRIPDKSSKLFDALIRGGEPCSQTQIAKRVQATQSDIAKAFNWLVTYGYVIGDKYKGEKATSYRVNDRLFCQFYRMRHLRQQQSTKLTILTDLLADTILFKDKWLFADKYSKQGLDPEARTMIDLGLQEKSIGLENLPERFKSTEQLLALGKALAKNDEIEDHEEFMQAICDQYTSNDDFIAYAKQLKTAASASTRRFSQMTGTQFVQAIESSDSPLFLKAMAYRAMLNSQSTEDWQNLLNTLNNKDINILKEFNGIDLNILEQKAPLSLCLFTTGLYMLTRKLNNEVSAENNTSRTLNALIYVKRAFQTTQEILPNMLAVRFCIIATTTLINDKYANSAHHKLLLKIYSYVNINKENDQNKLISTVDNIANFALLLWENGRKSQALKILSKTLDNTTKRHNSLGIPFLFDAIIKIQAQDNNFDYIKSHIPKVDNVPFEQIYSGCKTRCIINLEGFRQGWQHLIANYQKNQFDLTLKQLTPIVLDYHRHRSTAEAFAVANQLFEHIINEPLFDNEASIRIVWIELIEIGVPLELLTDIIDEQLQIAAQSLQPLNEVISQWIDYLKTPAIEREKYSRKLPPDVAASFKALGQELSSDAKQRYGFEEKN